MPTKKKPAAKKRTAKRAVKTSAATKPETILVLRTCDKDGKGYGGFQWPKSGPVSAPDWNNRPVCGGGLHGLAWGCGNGGYLSWDESATWLVVEVLASEIVAFEEKVKFPKGVVVFYGDRKGATEFIANRKEGAIAGYTATAGYAGTATAGTRGTATAGDAGTATAGYAGTATAGYAGTATAGDAGTATAGDAGTATAGYAGTATAGTRGTATAGENGIICIKHWDGSRHRLLIGYVGENGIEPGVKYKVDETGKIVKAA